MFSIHLTNMNYTEYSCKELIAICKTKGIKGYSNKKKQELIELIKATDTSIATATVIATDTAIINKGTGAGGANTNYYGKQFEEKTNPDEAYIIEYTSGRKIIKILEKKEQNVEGSVETKLWSGPSLKREYELVLGPEFEVFYGFCVNKFLKNKFISNEKKYTILNTILTENNISVLFGEDENYFETFDTWFNNSL